MCVVLGLRNFGKLEYGLVGGKLENNSKTDRRKKFISVCI